MVNDAPTLNRDAIALRIPHQGRMCLLDSVLEWNHSFICCQSLSHLATDHPLRAHDRLGAACGVEYAAQAMAVHGALIAEEAAVEGVSSSPPRAGYLASMRSVVLHVERLDTVVAPLLVKAERISGDANTVLYSFTVHADGHLLLSGRAAVVLNASQLSLDSQQATS